MMCLNIGTPNNHHFPFGTNGKVVALVVLIPYLSTLGVWKILKFHTMLNGNKKISEHILVENFHSPEIVKWAYIAPFWMVLLEEKNPFYSRLSDLDIWGQSGGGKFCLKAKLLW